MSHRSGLAPIIQWNASLYFIWIQELWIDYFIFNQIIQIDRNVQLRKKSLIQNIDRTGKNSIFSDIFFYFQSQTRDNVPGLNWFENSCTLPLNDVQNSKFIQIMIYSSKIARYYMVDMDMKLRYEWSKESSTYAIAWRLGK